MRLAACMYLAALLSGGAWGQQIGTVDLRHPKKSKVVSLNGCRRLSPGIIGDGVPPRDSNLREITLQFVKLSPKSVREGGAVDAVVEMRNTGDVPIEVPWSAEPNTAWASQKPKDLEWSTGDFEVLMTDSAGNHFGLKTVSGSLYGSKQIPSSFLSIRPGEWISAKIRFHMADEYPVAGRGIARGEAKVAVKWQREDIAWSIGKSCSVGEFYRHYDSYYKQDEPSADIFVQSR